MSNLIGIFSKGCGNTVIKKYYGFEKNLNVTFTDALFWTCGPQWSIGAGVASYNNAFGGNMWTSPTGGLIVGKKYKLEYTISGAVGNKILTWTNQGSNVLFNEWPVGGLGRANGVYSEIVTCILGSSTFGPYGYAGGLSFNMDNLSLKQLIQFQEDE